MTVLYRSIAIYIVNMLYIIVVHCRSRTFTGVTIDYFTQCPDKTYPNKMENQTIFSLTRERAMLNADIEVSKVSKELSVFVLVSRCATRADEVCEEFIRVPVEDFCHMFTDKGEFWSIFYDAITPRPYCPVKLGHYYVRNATLDFSMLFKYAPKVPDAEDYYWKSKTQFFSQPEKEEIMCFIGGGRIVNFKKH